MQRVLFIAYFYPPLAVSGSLRTLSFSRCLPDFGWEPIVLTVNPETVYPAINYDLTLAADMPPSIKVNRVNDSNPIARLIALRNRLKRTRVMDQGPRFLEESPVRTEGGKHTLVRSKLNSLQSALFEFPDHQKFWRSPARGKGRTLIRDWQVNAIYATGSPWTSLLVGAELAQEFSLPFVADFRDPWTDNPYSILSKIQTQRARVLEEKVCETAAKVVANTAELAQTFRAKYPRMAEKFLAITNGFDSAAFQDKTYRRKPEKRPNASADSRLELCHFGSVYSNRNPYFLLQGLQELVHEKNLSPGDVLLRFVGHWQVQDDKCEELAAELERGGFIRREPQLPHGECLIEMQQSSILLLLQPDSHLQIPGKLYEYIATGKPVVLIGGKGATANLVREHQLGLCCENEPGRIRDFLTSLLTGQASALLPPTDSVQRFNYSHLTQRMANVFNSVSCNPTTEPAFNSSELSCVE